jgi:NADH:ubiquinone oxidoreductase subunit E
MSDRSVDKIVPAWSAPNRARAATLLGTYPERRSAVMPLLYLAALEHGHVTNDAMHEVAELTGLTAAQVQSVASFYTMYKRSGVGRYLLSVCTSISCYLMGGDEVLAAIEDGTGTLGGETSDDGLFSVEHVECIGACGGAPAVQVNYELIEGVHPDKALTMCQWLKTTQPDVVMSDDLQQRFGDQVSFDWGPEEPEGAIAPVPAFGPYGSAAEGEA